MKVSILIVTYARDLPFAWYALRSIDKFATGFHSLTVVVPNQDVPAFAAIAGNAHVVGFNERPFKGMLHHQVMICRADELCPGADAILHMDADCLFTEPVTPDDYIHDGKLVMLYQPYEEFRDWNNRYSWKKCVRDATGIDPDLETMCRHPSIHIREVYPKVRELITEHVHGDWQEYVLSCRNEYPQTFAEFPTIGAVALKYFHDCYHWAKYPTHNDGSMPQLVREKMMAFWSHGGLNHMNERHPGKTAKDAMEEILAK